MYFFQFFFNFKFFGFLFLAGLYYRTYQTIHVNYKKVKTLRDTVATQYTSPYMIWKKTFEIIFKSLKIRLINFIDNRVKKINRNTYEISYNIEGKDYCIVTKIKRGPASILDVVNESGENRRDILPYLNKFNKNLTPSYFNENVLYLYFLNDESIKFEKDDILKF